jgi:signal transduction histidine kinase
LTTFATQAAVAIENARLYTRTDQALAARVAELETLNQIDQDLNARLDLNHVLDITRHWAITGTDAAQGWVALREEETNTLQLVPGSQENLVPVAVDNALVSLNAETPSNIIELEDDSRKYLLAPIFHGGEIIGALAVAQDTSFPDSAQEFLGRLAGHASAAIQNARLHQIVQQANEAKSQFVSIVTHELRIPLTSIKGYTDLIRQKAVGEINEQQLSFLNIIRNNVERMATLISDLSDISRIERGKLKLEPKSIHLHDQVEETLNGLRHRLEVKSQSLETDIPDDLPDVFADPNRLVQVLTNLVSNAWKYTPVEGHIIVRARQKDQIVHIAVIDNGIGISQEDQEKLFTQFFRSENPAVREVTGWGLGLSVTQRLVEIMGGDIGFESTLGDGSTFWFTLPVAG